MLSWGPTVLHAVAHDYSPCSYSGRKIAVGLTLLVEQDRRHTLYVILLLILILLFFEEVSTLHFPNLFLFSPFVF